MVAGATYGGWCNFPREYFELSQAAFAEITEDKAHFTGRKKARKGSSPLPWSVRYKVAIGIAEAVAYLHSGTERCVVHRDIKPSNIQLSSKKTPNLCDFGLATWNSAPSTPFLCKTVKGTFGYLAPQYFQHGKVLDKTEVYAFGVENLVVWGCRMLKVFHQHSGMSYRFMPAHSDCWF